MNPYDDMPLSDDPPMPWNEYRDKAFRDLAAAFAKFWLISLSFMGIVWPWKHWAACLPFVVLLVAGVWMLAGGRKQ